MESYKKNCVNKAKPMLQCNGKCQMLKKMKKQDAETNSNTAIPKFNTLEEVLSSKSYFPSLDLVSVEEKQSFILFNTRFSSSFLGSVFHPPTV